MFAAKILADSINRSGTRLSTLQLTFPRFILAEVNTHRVLSKNSASSRAIPVEKQLAWIREDPFIPLFWGKNQKGMQASEQLSSLEQEEAKILWLSARDTVIKTVELLIKKDGLNVHKQTANRLLEPWMWHTAIITGTRWANFENLRDSEHAQPEFRRIVQMAKEVRGASTPVLLQPGQWHLPLTPDITDLRLAYTPEQIARIACARCARVSYLTHDGIRAPAEDLSMADRLQTPGHMSPFEHVAQAGDTYDRGPSGNLHGGWFQYRKMLPNEAVFPGATPAELE